MYLVRVEVRARARARARERVWLVGSMYRSACAP